MDDIIDCYGLEGAKEILSALSCQMGSLQIVKEEENLNINTIPDTQDENLPEKDSIGLDAEKINLWNAMAMVVRAGKRGSELGGHISTYASSSMLYRIGLDYFFKGYERGYKIY